MARFFAAIAKISCRADIDPVCFDSPCYIYPEGPIAVETVRVIGAAMGKAGVAGIGRLTLSRRERMAMIKPRGPGMALSTLRSADEVRAAQFAVTEGEFDQEMVAIAEAIIRASLLMRLAGQISLPALPKMDQNYA